MSVSACMHVITSAVETWLGLVCIVEYKYLLKPYMLPAMSLS